MAEMSSPAAVAAQLRPVLHATAKNLLHHLYGAEGLPWGTRFAELEDLVVELCDSLGSELLGQALQRQAQQPVPKPLQHCPSCGRSAPLGDLEPRTVTARRGRADWQEPSSHCDRCRKAFFPSVQEPGH